MRPWLYPKFILVSHALTAVSPRTFLLQGGDRALGDSVAPLGARGCLVNAVRTRQAKEHSQQTAYDRQLRVAVQLCARLEVTLRLHDLSLGLHPNSTEWS